MTTLSLEQFTPASGSYELIPENSTVEFTMRHMFGLGKVHGTFTLIDGEVTVGSAPSESSARATAHVGSFKTDNAKRDDHVRSAAFLDAENHPRLHFRSTSFGPVDGEVRLSGVLAVKGVEEPLELVVTDFESTADGFIATASARVDRLKHHVRGGRGMVGRWLDVTVSVAAKAA